MKDGLFEVGDLVYLKSGSIRQVVTAVTNRELAGMPPKQVMITTAWVHYETQIPYSMSAPPEAFDPVFGKKTKPEQPYNEEVPY